MDLLYFDDDGLFHPVMKYYVDGNEEYAIYESTLFGNFFRIIDPSKVIKVDIDKINKYMLNPKKNYEEHYLTQGINGIKFLK